MNYPTCKATVIQNLLKPAALFSFFKMNLTITSNNGYMSNVAAFFVKPEAKKPSTLSHPYFRLGINLYWMLMKMQNWNTV